MMYSMARGWLREPQGTLRALPLLPMMAHALGWFVAYTGLAITSWIVFGDRIFFEDVHAATGTDYNAFVILLFIHWCVLKIWEPLYVMGWPHGGTRGAMNMLSAGLAAAFIFVAIFAAIWITVILFIVGTRLSRPGLWGSAIIWIIYDLWLVCEFYHAVALAIYSIWGDMRGMYSDMLPADAAVAAAAGQPGQNGTPVASRLGGGPVRTRNE